MKCNNDAIKEEVEYPPTMTEMGLLEINLYSELIDLTSDVSNYVIAKRRKRLEKEKQLNEMQNDLKWLSSVMKMDTMDDIRILRKNVLKILEKHALNVQIN